MTSLRGRGRGGPGGGLATGGIGGGARGGANGINGDGPNVRRGSWRGGPPGAGGVWGTPRGGSPAMGHSSSPAPRQSINDHMNVIGKVTGDKSKSAATRTFATDKDISGAASGGAQRELQPWSSDESPAPATNGKANGSTAGARDLETFGSSGTTSNIPWDQFETNSRLFGATTDYQEEIYTTKLNKSTPDYKSREKEATRLANEIMGQTSNNAHVAEERNQAVADHSKDEEDKYSGVQRNPNAYVPPAARRAGNAGSQAAPSPRPSAAQATEPKSNGAVPAAQPELLVAPAVTRSTSDDPAIKAEPLADVKKPQSPPAKSTSGLTAPPAPTPEKEGQQGQTVVDHFRQFVGSERERAEAKKQSLAKQDRERTLADFKKFGTSFNIPLPMPKDILPLLSKDEDKQKAIEAKAAVNLEKAKAAKTQSPAALKSPPAAPASATPTSKKIAMKIPEIPPFKPRQSLAAHPVPPPPVITVPEGAERDIPMPTSPTPSAGSHASANALAKLNPKASAFVFKPTAAAFKPGQASTVTSSPVAKPPTVSPAAGPSQPKNPFFGSQIPQSKGISPRDDFNPWKHDQVVPAASSILPQWPYTGRKHNAAFLGGPMHVMPMGGGFDEDPNNLHAGPPQLLPGMPPNFPPYPYRYQPGMPPQGMPGQMGSPMFSPGPNYQQLPGMQPPMHMGGPPQQNGMPLHYFQNGMPHNPQFMPPQHMQFNPNSPQRHGPGGPVPGGPGGPSGPGGPGPGHSPMFYQQHQIPTPQQTPQMHHNALQPPPQPQFQSSPLQPPPIPGGGFDGGGHQ